MGGKASENKQEMALAHGRRGLRKEKSTTRLFSVASEE